MLRSGHVIARQAESADSRMQLSLGGSDAKELDTKNSDAFVLRP